MVLSGVEWRSDIHERQERRQLQERTPVHDSTATKRPFRSRENDTRCRGACRCMRPHGLRPGDMRIVRFRISSRGQRSKSAAVGGIAWSVHPVTRSRARSRRVVTGREPGRRLHRPVDRVANCGSRPTSFFVARRSNSAGLYVAGGTAAPGFYGGNRGTTPTSLRESVMPETHRTLLRTFAVLEGGLAVALLLWPGVAVHG